ncbi:MAG: hypothetical protein NT069_29285, partial [Planctomycetota bacterium]|nr:hypothetical protein [Planctomycetota bacterium]
MVAWYDYRDELGVLQFQVVRFDPKGFGQRRPKPGIDQPASRNRHHWLWDMEGVRRVPYMLPRIIETATGPERFISTTMPGGAGKWLPQYNEHFRDRHVAIIPDEDTPDPKTGRRVGIEHAYEVARNLHGIAKSIKILFLSTVSISAPNPDRPLPDPAISKIDTGIWADSGGRPIDLISGLGACPLWSPSPEDPGASAAGGDSNDGGVGEIGSPPTPGAGDPGDSNDSGGSDIPGNGPEES